MRVHRKTIRRTSIVLGCGFLGLALFYWYQPWEVDLIHRTPPILPLIDPDSQVLFLKGTRVLIVAAHPDDAEFYLAGLLDKLGKCDATMRLVVATDGDKGYYPFGDSVSLGKVRRDEQTRAAKEWNCDDVHFIGLPDGRLNSSDALHRKIGLQLTEFRPQYVFSFDPKNWPRASHADHRRCGEAVATAIEDIKFNGWHCMFQTESPNWCFDVTGAWQRRWELLAFHRSQWPNGSKGDFGVVNQIIESFSRDFGKRIRVKFAEGFRCVRTYAK